MIAPSFTMVQNLDMHAMIHGILSADTRMYHRERCNLGAGFAVMIGFMFGFIVAEIAYRYFEIDLPTFF